METLNAHPPTMEEFEAVEKTDKGTRFRLDIALFCQIHRGDLIRMAGNITAKRQKKYPELRNLITSVEIFFQSEKPCATPLRSASLHSGAKHRACLAIRDRTFLVAHP